ncbi:hypothetical protein CKA32_000768 [Geitlerinema sp. FC II]|nr:hypothetical protein CKA32_000768 [Geitlerinema sp. FC II]
MPHEVSFSGRCGCLWHGGGVSGCTARWDFGEVFASDRVVLG